MMILQITIYIHVIKARPGEVAQARVDLADAAAMELTTPIQIQELRRAIAAARQFGITVTNAESRLLSVEFKIEAETKQQQMQLKLAQHRQEARNNPATSQGWIEYPGFDISGPNLYKIRTHDNTFGWFNEQAFVQAMKRFGAKENIKAFVIDDKGNFIDFKQSTVTIEGARERTGFRLFMRDPDSGDAPSIQVNAERWQTLSERAIHGHDVKKIRTHDGTFGFFQERIEFINCMKMLCDESFGFNSFCVDRQGNFIDFKNVGGHGVVDSNYDLHVQSSGLSPVTPLLSP